MKILFFGDIVGKSGRESVKKFIFQMRGQLAPDLIIANADNLAHGFGMNKSTAEEMFSCGVDVLTGGNHIWDQKDSINFIAQSHQVLRPHNYPTDTPAVGCVKINTKGGQSVLVLHLQGQINMPQFLNSPFYCADDVLKKYTLGKDVNAIFIDFHAETTSEKMCMGHYLDGRVSAVVGTHTHVPSADERVLSGGTAYMTDVGMCGAYDSMLGMSKQSAMNRILKQHSLQYNRFSPSDGQVSVCAVLIDINDNTGLASSIKPIRFGGCLSQTVC